MNIHKITRYLLMLCAFTFLTLTAKGQDGEPLRLAVAGVSHGHLWEVISRLDRGDFKIVGVAEKDDYLREHNGLRDKLDPNLFYADLGEMLDKPHPEAVIVYEPIHDHLRVVRRRWRGCLRASDGGRWPTMCRRALQKSWWDCFR